MQARVCCHVAATFELVAYISNSLAGPADVCLRSYAILQHLLLPAEVVVTRRFKAGARLQGPHRLQMLLTSYCGQHFAACGCVGALHVRLSTSSCSCSRCNVKPWGQVTLRVHAPCHVVH
jgi:hypothetical protein